MMNRHLEIDGFDRNLPPVVPTMDHRQIDAFGELDPTPCRDSRSSRPEKSLVHAIEERVHTLERENETLRKKLAHSQGS
jgi:hypothetical protein